MIRVNTVPPQMSWTNPSPIDFNTGFQQTAHVPPMAIGPQFAPAMSGIGQGEGAVMGIGIAGVALVALVGLGTLALGFYAIKKLSK